VRTRRWTDGAASADVATATLTVETETGLVCSQATAGLFDGDAHVDLVARCIPRASSAEDWGLQVFTGRGENADSTEFELVESEIAEIEAAFPR
jgi:hypothetical protein